MHNLPDYCLQAAAKHAESEPGTSIHVQGRQWINEEHAVAQCMTSSRYVEGSIPRNRNVACEFKQLYHVHAVWASTMHVNSPPVASL